jgi:hypothetical protein
MFIPSKNFIVSSAMERKEGFFTSLFFSNYSIFDQRGNLVRNCSTEEEKNWHKIMQTYNWMMQLKIESLNHTLDELISTKKITLEAIYNEMINKTWLSYVYRYSYDGKEIRYTCSNILHTLLKEYFCIYDKYLSREKILCTELMMFIDSATLKFEGLIRELFTLKNYPTIIQNNDAETVREKDLNALLYDENIKTFLDDDELLFFKYLFIDQEGLNLRNRVAHSLLLEQEYNLGFANLLFLAILRLFKFYIDIK